MAMEQQWRHSTPELWMERGMWSVACQCRVKSAVSTMQLILSGLIRPCVISVGLNENRCSIQERVILSAYLERPLPQSGSQDSWCSVSEKENRHGNLN